jgi:hypothetical protein
VALRGAARLGVIVAATGVGSGYLLIAIPCMVMMGAMIWMILGASGDTKR